MKVKLVVAQGVHTGREIPLAGQEFTIGRDPQCQLRPSSPAISKKHCAVVVRGQKVFVRDFGSTNGTFVNGEPVRGEVEVKDQAALRAGPLDFTIRIEGTAVEKALKTPVAASSGDDDFAAFLLDGDAPSSIPEGSTVMEMKSVPFDDPNAPADPSKKEEKPAEKKPEPDTQKSAADILKMYHRRPRS